MSDIIGNAQEGDLWITLQINKNIVAVAVMKGLAGIILINNRIPDEDTLAKAVEEDIPILQTSLSAFELTGRIYAMGLRGTSPE